MDESRRPYSGISEIVPSSLKNQMNIHDILSVADEIQDEDPHVSRILCEHVSSLAQNLDPNSEGMGVVQFKACLMSVTQETKEHGASFCVGDDIARLREFYKMYREKHDIDNLWEAERKLRHLAASIVNLLELEHITLKRKRASATLLVLSTVLEQLTTEHCSEETESLMPQELLCMMESDTALAKDLVTYNIIPVDAPTITNHIMSFPEVRVAVSALKYFPGLPKLPGNFFVPPTRSVDMFDLMSCVFGFQKDNVSNQREHIVHLLANEQSRIHKTDEPILTLDEDAVQQVFLKSLGNYLKWCSYLFIQPVWHDLETLSKEKKLLSVSLYFLIWGEASNIRFLPECLCYIFHHMYRELDEVIRQEVVKPANSCVSETGVSFLDEVIRPLYDVVAVEISHNDNGQVSHSAWRNYDDFNEYFWSLHCFELSWPWRKSSTFFVRPTPTSKKNSYSSLRRRKRLGKTFYVEHQTFLHLYHSFSRLWKFLFMMFQGLAIIAFNGGRLDSKAIKEVLSIGLTYILMTFLQSVLDIVMMIGAYSTSRRTTIVRLFLRCLWFSMASAFFCSLYLKAIDGKSNSNAKSNLFITYEVFLSTYVVVHIVFHILWRISTFHRSFHRCLNRSMPFRFIKWMLEGERYYVGRGMDIETYDFIKYMVFWLFLFGCKFSFSYFLQIKPLVKPTRAILHMHIPEHPWHEIFSKSSHKALMIASIWLPVIFMYLLDIHIFYTITSAVWSFLSGARKHLWKIKHLGLFHKRFETFPEAFVKSLRSPVANKPSLQIIDQVGGKKRVDAAQFAPFWNEIIRNMREEDCISNLEMELLFMPTQSGSLPVVQWPLFLLSDKIFLAKGITQEIHNSQEKLWNKISRDCYLKYAVEECYYSIKLIFTAILDDEGVNWVECIYEDIQGSIVNGSIHTGFQLNVLPLVIQKVAVLMQILKEDETSELGSGAVNAIQEIFNIIQHDFLSINTRNHYERWHLLSREGRLFQQLKWPRDAELRGHIRRLYLLLTIKDLTGNIPKNVEVRRRLEFFTNSLFMEMPLAKPVHETLSLSVFAPSSSEVVLYSMSELLTKNADGVSLLIYLQDKYPDDWRNFLGRIGCDQNLTQLQLEDNPYQMLEVRFWASYRGLTLARTVRGMMYYRKALMLQAYLEHLKSEDFEPISLTEAADVQGFWLSPEARAQADLKFACVIMSLTYGKQKNGQKPQAADIALLMERNEALRVAFVDEVETLKHGILHKEFYSKLVKADFRGKAKEIYSIRLPGNPTLGEERAENYNHAIIFTRGTTLQKIDVYQDHYPEEALKMRNLLEEFSPVSWIDHPTILGVREHMFTESASFLSSFVSNQETGFLALGQHTLANLLKVRKHYGHPYIFDRIFHVTRGGISKASRVINMSEDISAVLNSILRGGNVTYREYIQVGMGQNLALNQIALYEGKIAGGYGGQVLCRDVYRLGRFFNFFRMVSFYITTIGYYFCAMLMVLTVYVFLYGQAYWALCSVGKVLQVRAEVVQNTALTAALSMQFLYEIGVFSAVPMVLAFILEQGMVRALTRLITMQLLLSAVFFTFLLGTRTHYFARTILHGGARYQAEDRRFLVHHIKFAENYRLYSRSHFLKGMEILLLLVVYLVYGCVEDGEISCTVLTLGSWFLAISWLCAPYIFNPYGFEWHKTVDDFRDWVKWLLRNSSLGVQGEESWEAWWDEDLAHIQSFGGRVVDTILNLRFFIFQYGFVTKLSMHGNGTSIMAYGLSWIVFAVLIILLKIFSFSQKILVNFQLLVQLIQAAFLLLAVAGLTVAIIFAKLSASDILACLLAIVPTGLGILGMASAWKPWMIKLGLWKSIRSIARLYDAGMGFLIFIPVALFSCIPFISRIQNQFIFN